MSRKRQYYEEEYEPKRYRGGDASMPLGPTDGPAEGVAESEPVRDNEADIPHSSTPPDPISKQQNFAGNMSDRVNFDIIKNDGLQKTYASATTTQQQCVIAWNIGSFCPRADSKIHFQIETPVNPHLANKKGLWKVGKELRLIYKMSTFVGTSNLEIGGGSLSEHDWIHQLIRKIHCGELFPNQDIYEEDNAIRELKRFGFISHCNKLQMDPSPVNLLKKITKRWEPGHDLVVDWYMNPDNIVTFDENGQLKIDVYIPLWLLSEIFTSNICENTPIRIQADLVQDVRGCIIPWHEAMSIYETIKAVNVFGTVGAMDYSLSPRDQWKSLMNDVNRLGLLNVAFDAQDRTAAQIKAEIVSLLPDSNDENPPYYPSRLTKYMRYNTVPRPLDIATPADEEFNPYWNPGDVKPLFVHNKCFYQYKRMTLENDIRMKKESMKLQNLCVAKFTEWKSIQFPVPQGVEYNSEEIPFNDRPRSLCFGMYRNSPASTGFFASQYLEAPTTETDYPGMVENDIYGSTSKQLKYGFHVDPIAPQPKDFDMSIFTGFRIGYDCATFNEWEIRHDVTPYFQDWVNGVTTAKMKLNSFDANITWLERLRTCGISEINDVSQKYFNVPAFYGPKAFLTINPTGDNFFNSVHIGSIIHFIAKHAYTKGFTSSMKSELNPHYQEIRNRWRAMFLSGKSPHSLWRKIDITEQYITGVGDPGGVIFMSLNPREGWNPEGCDDPSTIARFQASFRINPQAHDHIGYNRHLVTTMDRDRDIPAKDRGGDYLPVYVSNNNGTLKTNRAEYTTKAAGAVSMNDIANELNALNVDLKVPLERCFIAGAERVVKPTNGTFEMHGFNVKEAKNQYLGLTFQVDYSVDRFVTILANNQAEFTQPQSVGF